MDAPTEVELVARLRAQKLIPVTITANRDVGRQVSGQVQQLSARIGKVDPKSLAIFSRQFGTMYNAGITILQALRICASQTEHRRLRDTLHEVARRVETGETLTAAMRAFPQVFPEIFIDLVAAGEMAGALDETMERVSRYLEEQHELRQKVKSAMTYPVAVAVVAILVSIFLITFVMPNFATLFSSLGAALPWPTRMMLALGDFLGKWWWAVILGMGGIALGLHGWFRTATGRRFKDRISFKLPVFGELTTKNTAAQFCRTFATLTKSGVPILAALNLMKRTAGNVLVEEAVDKAMTRISAGQGMSATFAESGIFPRMVTEMMSVGEATGNLDGMLEKAADFFEADVRDLTGRISAMLEPMIVVVLGAIVGFIIISVALPMFDMMGAVM
jgi:type IV pilus assembly protein PilC